MLSRYAVGHSYNASDRINARANIAYAGVNDWFDIYERCEALNEAGIDASMFILISSRMRSLSWEKKI